MCDLKGEALVDAAEPQTRRALRSTDGSLITESCHEMLTRREARVPEVVGSP